MPIVPKNWQNSTSPLDAYLAAGGADSAIVAALSVESATPLDAAALTDLEERMGAYADGAAGGYLPDYASTVWSTDLGGLDALDTGTRSITRQAQNADKWNLVQIQVKCVDPSDHPGEGTYSFSVADDESGFGPSVQLLGGGAVAQRNETRMESVLIAPGAMYAVRIDASAPTGLIALLNLVEVPGL